MDPKFTEFPDNFHCSYTSAEGTAAFDAITSDPWTQAIQPPNYMRQEFMFVPLTVNNNNLTEVSIIHHGCGT